MDEGSRVTRRILFNLADKATRYFNHWLFLDICVAYGVIPNGLKLKKSAQIGATSNVFKQKWSYIISSAEQDMLRALNEEYKSSCLDIQTKFWEKIVQFLSDAANAMSVSEVLSSLQQHISTIDDNFLRRRHKKLTNLLGTKNFLNLDKDLVQRFQLPRDLASVMSILETSENQLGGTSGTIENEFGNRLETAENQNAAELGGPLGTIENEFGDRLETAENRNAAELQNIRRILMENEEEYDAHAIHRNSEETRTFGEISSEENTQQDVNSTNFEYKVDNNGRIEGQFLNDKVVNLSKRALSESEISALSKGLKFVMTPKELDYSQIKVDLESFGRRLRLKWHFWESEDFSEYPAFRPRSKFNPRHKNAAIELYLSKLEEELMSISAQGNNYSNVSREESKAINSLRSDRTIVVKEADKGSGVVVWDREDYITEAESQLGDSEVYSRLDNDPSERLHQIISDTLKKISDRGDLDQTTLDYLMVNNPRLGRFYLLPKIHKRLNSVPGRPVISNCGFFTENISAFLDHHLQPLAKKVRSYIKDTNHFLKKIMDLDGLPDGAILCTVDVVGLYPSIPHEEGLEALKGVLEHREDKTISTDTLLELAHVVL